jgi:hypothetical protein
LNSQWIWTPLLLLWRLLWWWRPGYILVAETTWYLRRGCLTRKVQSPALALR